MTVKNFENGCVAYAEGKRMMDRAEKVLDVLLEANDRMRALEIAKIVFSEKELRYRESCISQITWSLRHLVDCGLVVKEVEEGEPIEITVLGRIPVDLSKYDEVIVVEGIHYYKDENGEYKRIREYRWGDVPKTVTPKISYFKVVE